MMKPLRNILITITVGNNEKIIPALVLRLVQWAKMGAGVAIIKTPLIDEGRNMCVKEFLKSKKKYMLFIDSDTVPGVDGPQRLLKHKKDIVAGLYMLLTSNSEGKVVTVPSSATLMIPNKGLTEWPLVTPNTGLQKVKMAATGYLLINRKAILKIPEPWFEIRWVNPQHSAYYGEDVVFSLNCEQAGIQMWCDTNNRALHYKEITI